MDNRLQFTLLASKQWHTAWHTAWQFRDCTLSGLGVAPTAATWCCHARLLMARETAIDNYDRLPIFSPPLFPRRLLSLPAATWLFGRSPFVRGGLLPGWCISLFVRFLS